MSITLLLCIYKSLHMEANLSNKNIKLNKILIYFCQNKKQYPHLRLKLFWAIFWKVWKLTSLLSIPDLVIYTLPSTSLSTMASFVNRLPWQPLCSCLDSCSLGIEKVSCLYTSRFYYKNTFMTTVSWNTFAGDSAATVTGCRVSINSQVLPVATAVLID